MILICTDFGVFDNVDDTSQDSFIWVMIWIEEEFYTRAPSWSTRPIGR
ncbi:MAG TPA: hypothetical protein VEA41_22640 [Salinarimonas sp.]|nr:hypothetical protein [Salinarimonas sp.]